MRLDLYEQLTAYGRTDMLPFHMPGHKRNSGIFGFNDPFSFDITEIDGFDNLHHADGILREAMEEAAQIYGSGFWLMEAVPGFWQQFRPA